tara:strand:+ start:401 stop:559 length:159 start_codon:yes stop_codon:yes gene_type:complete
MYKKIVTVEVTYDSEETWEKSLQEIKEVFMLMNSVSRHAQIIGIEQGVNNNE